MSLGGSGERRGRGAATDFSTCRDGGVRHDLHHLNESAKFLTTRWVTLAAAATEEGAWAREELARIYWGPLYAYARARGASAQDASDVVQTFLAGLFARNRLNTVSVEGGRFRDFLRTGIHHLLISEHRKRSSQRRLPEGGFVVPDPNDAERHWEREAVDGRSPEQLFDRLCARALLEAARERLRATYQRAGRLPIFEHLIAHLDEDPESASHEVAAREFGLASGSLRNEAVRFRRQFQVHLRDVAAGTWADPGRVDHELRELMASLAG